jgi:LmbE family N-acetylglucosaminyl deacetylase
MKFINFLSLERSQKIALLFPGWKKGEKVAFYSPHDDDAILGAGYLILATIKSGGAPYVFVFCQGDAGYSTLQEKRSIVKRRKKEAALAYGRLGVPENSVHFFDIPDFSLMGRLDRRLPQGKGVFDPMISTLRAGHISRAVFSSGYLEHWDHTAVFNAGVYLSSQAQDPILVDLGKPFPMKTYLAYSVWGNFEPSPFGRDEIRADLGVLAAAQEENRVLDAIKAFSSQDHIIQDIVAHREKRRSEEGYLELYKNIPVREPIDYSAYFHILRKIS